MNVIITGAGGQLGRALLAATPRWARAVGLTRAQLDVGDAAEVARLINEYRPSLLINAAAFTQVDRAESDDALAMRINADAVGHLAVGLARVGGQLVHVSTDFVFDGSSSRPYRPQDPINPLSTYGRTKAAGEALAGCDALIVRTAWVYAAQGANFVRTMLRLLRERGEVKVVADQIGAPTWANRLAEVIWALAQTGSRGIYHYADAGVASWYDFAVAIAEEARAGGLLDRDVSVVPIGTADYPTPAHRPAFSLLDSNSTLQTIDQPATHWRQNLRRAIKEMGAFPNLQ